MAAGWVDAAVDDTHLGVGLWNVLLALLIGEDVSSGFLIEGRNDSCFRFDRGLL
jgi:hypothetical protein